ncbi:ATP-binding cassette domain-containing protein [Sandaracinobacter neustonicus]|uniref:ATP-binding cassette domain-containing protein n=1 Tax=Sandaracinobacter neustonicus TaxID=1715348 RepID=A0A501XHR3_9SPHN|nr:ATP-binding cassette domain-containing protein [Sandaracinobacter neustonicus]TPE60171.1 ATP-binding cassette domain-containing protein [Sandaracinobacter neustonicus]
MSEIDALIAEQAAAQARTMRRAIACAVAAALAGSILLGLSGWFLAGAGLAGLAGAAAAFNYLIPSAFIRLSAIVRTAGRYGERLLSHKAAFFALAEVRTGLIGRLAALDPRQARPLTSGEAVARLTADIDAVEARLVQAPARPAALAAIAIALILAAWASPLALAPLALVFLALPWATARIARRFVDRPAADAQRLHGQLKAELAELLSGGPELAIYGLADTATAQLRATAERMDQARRAAARGSAFAAGLLALCGPLLAALIFAAAPGNAPAAAAAALAVLVAVEAMAGPLRFRLEEARTRTGLARLEALSAEPEPRRRHLPPGAQPIEIDGLRLEPGQTLALTGPSGSGKTRILETLAGLRTDAPEPLAVNGEDPRQLQFESLSAQFALARQDPALIAGSVEDNLRLARPGLSEAQLWAALETACLSADVRALPHGLSTFLGDSGARLSGGQRKRLALARALLAGRPWLLLDEPSEGLDAATEAELARRLTAWLAETGAGAVIATHRPAMRGVAGLEMKGFHPFTPAGA